MNNRIKIRHGSDRRRRARWLWLAVLAVIAAVLWLFFDIIEQAWQ
jgi:predicted nucleic acid-binding Zn ribbon protein